jgi:hypothetical protein
MATRAERLQVLLQKFAPETVAYEQQHKRWPGALDRMTSPDDQVSKLAARISEHDGVDADIANMRAQATLTSRAFAPYTIQTSETETRIVLTADDGSTIVGRGATIDEALTNLEARQ